MDMREDERRAKAINAGFQYWAMGGKDGLPVASWDHVLSCGMIVPPTEKACDNCEHDCRYAGTQPMHISEINPKTASNILASTMPDDSYHMAILSAASELVAMGKGYYRYHTQYVSGTTCWTCDNYLGTIPHALFVDTNGRVS